MKLVDMTVTSYLDLLNSDAPAPGGGSASALCGAQGAALVSMVAGLTIGKKKYPDDQELCAEVAVKASKLKDALLQQVDKDTEAFNLVSAAFKLPKETDEEKAARSKAIADATLVATQVPFETMKLCLEALQYSKALIGHSNTNAASDLGVSALNLITCMKGAWLNVLINLGGVKDEAKANEFRTKGEEMVKAAQKQADEIYKATLEIL
ncbi:MAG: cyclodeaminase/cyclohydrolase family protein [Clostridiales bacterium]|nr:cyclodeaminase/cyclohydrolase family protein [Clostridiales bacterium]